MRDAYAIVTAVLERLGDGERWCTGVMAKNADGRAVPYDSAEACEWCVLGAVAVEGRGAEPFAAGKAISQMAAAVHALGGSNADDSIPAWQDRATWKQVKTMLTRSQEALA